MRTSDALIGDPHVKTLAMSVSEPQPRGFVWPWQKPMTDVERRQTLPRTTGLPGRDRISHDLRCHAVSWLGELVGTFAFLFFAFAGAQVANSLPEANLHGSLLYTSLSFGSSLAVNSWVFFRISGGLFNPAVAFALALVGAVTWLRAMVCVVAELFGALAAAAVVSAMLPGHLSVDTKLGGGLNVAQGLFLEMLLTAELVFTTFMLAAEKHQATFIAPLGIGLALFIAVLAGGYYSGASLNPARSFAPAVTNGQFDSYHWIYWVGPGLGSLLAVCFYNLIKKLEYELANPGADDAGSMHEARLHHGGDGASEEEVTKQDAVFTKLARSGGGNRSCSRIA